MTVEYDPVPRVSQKVLPPTGTLGDVAAACALDIYTDDPEFISGAVDQVAYTYQQLGGALLGIEMTAEQVYNSYQAAALRWSTLVNLWQAKNALGSLLGSPTGSFTHEGEVTGSDVPGDIALTYPRFTIANELRVADGMTAVGRGGQNGPRLYSASIPVESGVQDYNLQEHISANPAYSASVGNKRVNIKKVYYRHASSIWRFFGYYGGLNVVGNLSTYGQYADDAVFEVVPTWQNKLQAMAFEDNFWTRTSHYSFEINGDWLRIWPVPGANFTQRNIWVQFTIPEDPWEGIVKTESGSVVGVYDDGTRGVNNLNNIPFANLPYSSSNAIAKDWIRRYALANAKTMVSYTRGKFKSLPYPDRDIELNAEMMRADGEREMTLLEDELKDILEATKYSTIAEENLKLTETSKETMKNVPFMPFYWTSGDR